MSNKVKLRTDIGESIHKFITAVAVASDSAFRVSRPGKRAMKERSVPWWNEDLSLLRKKARALRRRYQRTRNDENLRQQRRLQYREGNMLYQGKLRQAKLNSWKDFCSRTIESNPWNAVYRLATRKLHNKTTLSTFMTPSGSYTTDLEGTINQVMDHFIPEDDEGSDKAHKVIRERAREPLITNDDEELTKQEVLAVLERFDPSKAPGGDGLNSDILIETFKCFPNLFMEIYNACLRWG